VDEQNDWPQLLAGLRKGDAQSARKFWEKCGPVLQRLAHRHLPAGMRTRVDPEDVVQSACRTFLRHLQSGSYQATESHNFLSLLCAITLNKVLLKTRFHLAGRRDVRREVSAPADAPEESGLAYLAVDSELTPAEAAEFTDELEHLFESLDEEERRIVDLKLQGHSNPEIAAALHRTDRWVRKVFERLRVRLGRKAD
jgi:RNA polymerase sigma factor (sigma-70 family)